MNNFHVGQQVVCVDVTSPGGGSLSPLCKGAIYTVREVGLPSYVNGLPCIRLVEIQRGPGSGVSGSPLDDTPYYAWRFRPVVDRPTDISTFKKLLNPKPARELVNARE